MSLGSAQGSITLDSSGVTKGVQQAVAALRSFEAQTAGAGKNLDQIGQAGQRTGTAVAAGARQAATSLKEVGDAGKSAGTAVASGTDKAAQSVKNLAQSTEGIGAAFGQLSSAAAVFGGALAAGLGLAVKSAGDLQTAVTRISTIAPEINVSGVSRQLSQLSTEVGASAVSLAEAMNNIYSSIETNQAGALKLTEEFSKGALAAGTDAETFGGAILGVLNAYGLSVDQASHLSDVFFNTLDKGVINGQELASGLGQVTQSAKLAGVNFDTLGALIAGVTREGGNASVNVNNLSNALNKIVTADAQKALEGLGIQTKDAAGNFRNIVGVLTDLKAKLDTLSAGDRTKVLQDIFPDIQARAGISVLLNQLDTVNTVLESNANAAGKADAAYQKMSGTAEAAGNRLKASLTASLNELGDIALPGLAATATGLQKLLGAFATLPTGVKQTAVYAAEAAAALLLLGAGAVKAYTTVVQIAAGVRTLSAALPALTASMGPAIPVVLGFAAALVVLEAASRKTTGAGLLENAASIAKYGDVLAGARDDANAYAQANNNIPAVTDKLKSLTAQLELLATAQRKIDSGTPIDQLYDLLSGDQTKRNFDRNSLQKQIDLLAGYKHALDETAAAEYAAANPVLGPPVPVFGPKIEEAQQYQKELQRIADLQKPGGLAPAGANPNRGALQSEADVAGRIDATTQTQLNNQATAAYNAQQALNAYQQALNEAATANQSASSAIQGQIGPMVAALDLINQKRAQGLPLTAQEGQLLRDIPGAIGQATNAYNDLVVAQGQVALRQQQLATQNGQGSSAFAGYGGQIQALVGQFNQLTGAIAAADSAFSALGSENSKLSSQFNILGERITALQEKAKTPLGLNGDEQTELDTLLNTQTKIGDQIGTNAAKQRELVVAQQQQTEAALATAEAIKAAKAAQDIVTQNDPFTFREDLRGGAAASIFTPPPVQIPVALDPASVASIPGQIAGIDVPPIPVKVVADVAQTGADLGAKALAAFGGNADVKQSITVDVTDNATGPITAIQGSLSTLGGTVATPTLAVADQATAAINTVTSLLLTLGQTSATPVAGLEDNASLPLAGITAAVNALDGRGIHITASVDTSAALAAISDLRAHMPSSPAKKGPFHVLPEWGSVFNSLAPAADDAVLTIQSTTQAMSRALGGGIAELTDEAAKAAAELATTVAGAVSATTTALNGLRTFRPPDPSRFVALHDALIPILAAFTGDAAGSTEDGLKATSAYAENAQKIVGLVAQGADALTKLESFVRPTDAAIRAFRDASQFLVNVMVQVAADSAGDLVEAGGVYAESAGKIYAAVGQGVDALIKLQDFKRPSDKAVTDFRDVAQYVVNVLAQVARDAELDAVADAGSWGDSAGKVFAALGGGVAALVKLQDFQRPTDKAVTDFRDVSQFLVNVIAQVAADIDKDALANAGVYADTAGKIVALLGTGVDAFAKLASGELVLPDVGRLQAFAEATRQATVAISAAAAQIDGDAVDAAAVYADGAGKVVSLIGQGVQGFAGLSTFVAPSVGQINNFKSAVSATVIAIAQASREIDKDAVKAAGEYADGAGKAVGLLGGAVSAFKSIGDKDFVVPSKEAIDAVVSVTRYGVDQLIGISGSYSGGQLAQLSSFASAAGAGYNALGAALDASKALGTEGRIKPADAIGQAAAEFRDGLAPLSELVGISQTYATQGAQIGANIAQAYNAIAGGLPGYNTNQATVAANVTVSTPTQVIVHRAEGAVDIRFLGENGGWVVSSLQADKTARDGVIGIVAEGIAPIFAGMRG